MKATKRTVCPDCGELIQIGQEILPPGFKSETDDPGWVHKGCPPRPIPCGSCWLIHPEGECDR